MPLLGHAQVNLRRQLIALPVVSNPVTALSPFSGKHIFFFVKTWRPATVRKEDGSPNTAAVKAMNDVQLSGRGKLQVA
jgi:hypothetical protein